MIQPPLNLTDITLEKHVEYLQQYHDLLQEQFAAVQLLPEGSGQRAEAYRRYSIDESIYNYCHYTSTPLSEITPDNLLEVMTMQGQSFIKLKEQMLQLDVHTVFDFDNDKWQIQPLFTNTGKLNKREFDAVQDLALIFSDFQDGKHEALYAMCAAYLRKLGEQYHEDLVHHAGERVQLMRSLPLNMVLCVKQYVDNSVNLWLKTKDNNP